HVFYQPITYSGLNLLEVHTGQGVAPVGVYSTSAAKTRIKASSNANTIVTVGSASSTLDDLNGPLDIAGAGNTLLLVHDAGFDSKDSTYSTVTNNSVLRYGKAAITYGNLSLVNLYTASALNGVFVSPQISSTAPGTTYNVYAGPGYNQFRVYDDALTLNGIQRSLFLHGAGGTLPNNNAVFFHDVSLQQQQKLVLNAGATPQSGVVQRYDLASNVADMATINYDGMNAYSVLYTG